MTADTHVIIKNLMASGQSVRSSVAGCMGPIVGVSDNLNRIYIKLRRGGQGVTSLRGLANVSFVERNGIMFVCSAG